VNQVEVTPADANQFTPLRIVPSYPDLPMESVFTRPGGTHLPGAYLRTRGKGRVVYFPGDLDRTFWQVLAVDHGMLLRNAVEWATNEAPPVKVEGPGILDVAVWEQKASMTLHLVNLTNPMMWKRPGTRDCSHPWAENCIAHSVRSSHSPRSSSGRRSRRSLSHGR
jgi:hypothetical protein